MLNTFNNNPKSVYKTENFGKLTYSKQFANIMRLKDPIVFAEELLGIKLFDYQKKILADNSDRLHIRKGRQVGASFVLALKSVIHSILNPGITIAIISPSQRQSSLVFKYIKSIFTAHELLKPEIENASSRYSQTVIELPNGSIIYSLPCGNDGRTIRGISIGFGSLMIVDEAAFIPEKVWDVIDYFTATGGHEIMSSTPLSKYGRFYDSSLDPTYTHHHIRTYENPLVDKTWLENRKALPGYDSEILGEFIDGEGKFFPADIINACVDAGLGWDESPLKSAGTFKCAGVDVSIERDPCVITLVKRIMDIYTPVFIRAYKKKNEKTSYDVDYQAVGSYGDIVNEITRLNKLYEVSYWAIDATYNPYVAEAVGKIMNVFPIKFNSVSKTGNPMKNTLMDTLLSAMTSKILRIPNHPTLIRQLHNYEYEITANKNIVYSSTDEDFIDSLALSLYNELAISVADNFAVA